MLQEYILNTNTADDNPLFYNKKIERKCDRPRAHALDSLHCCSQECSEAQHAFSLVSAKKEYWCWSCT